MEMFLRKVENNNPNFQENCLADSTPITDDWRIWPIVKPDADQILH